MNVFVCNSENATSQGYLAHHGVDGQQWGQRNGPPYPLNKGGKAALRKQKKQARLEKKEEKKRQIQEKKEAKLKADKERIIRSGTAQEAMQYKGMWTNEELRRMMDRMNLEQSLARYSASEKKSVMDIIDKASRTASRMSDMGERFIKSYNTIAKVYNATESRKGELARELPIIGKDNKKKKGGGKGDNDIEKLTKMINKLVDQSEASEKEKKKKKGD